MFWTRLPMFQIESSMSNPGNRIQAEGVIKNIIREIVQECASRGEGQFRRFDTRLLRFARV